MARSRLYNNNNLTLGSVLRKMLNEVFESISQDLLMKFGDLATNGGDTFRAESLSEITESTWESHRRLIDYYRARVGGELGESCGETLLEGQESFESESVARDSGGYECRDERRRTGEALHLDAGIAAGTCEHKPGIANSGGTGVRHQGDILAGEEFLDDTGYGTMLIISVMAAHRGVDIVMLHQYGAGASIFGEYQIRLLKDADSSEGHILEVANRGRNYV